MEMMAKAPASQAATATAMAMPTSPATAQAQAEDQAQATSQALTATETTETATHQAREERLLDCYELLSWELEAARAETHRWRAAYALKCANSRAV